MSAPLSLADAAASCVTGDLWLFRGRKPADRAIQTLTNSPVNHVGIVLAIDDLPPLLWHSEMGSSLPDAWTGDYRRGAQLHRLEHAVAVWVHRYGQRPWLRQIDISPTQMMEDEFLRVVNEFGGRRFPRPRRLATKWLAGRVRRSVTMEELFCAELVALTYERLGLLRLDRPTNAYDPGSFWSGDGLRLLGASLGPEVEVGDVPPAPKRAATDQRRG